ncbi:MAG: hypothetical protein D6737_01425 [Chloroflexi bacterium]|nr:MAG: hypothetical protein D6737_01425 [Chloroflexota bacterium]
MVKIIFVLMGIVTLASCVSVRVSDDPALAATVISAVLPTVTPQAQPVATTTPPSATPSGAYNIDGTLPPPVDCTVTWTSGVERTFYYEPSESAEVFSTVGFGGNAPAQAMTTDGWIGFDPGIAQAGNTGFRRLRWLKQDDTVTLEGAGCASLPVYVSGEE